MLKNDDYTLNYMLRYKSENAESLFNNHFSINFNFGVDRFAVCWSNPPSHDFKYLKDTIVFEITDDISLFNIFPWSNKIDWYPSLPECWMWLYALESFISYFEMQNSCVIACTDNKPVFINTKVLNEANNFNISLPIGSGVKKRILTPYSESDSLSHQHIHSHITDWIKDLVC